MVTGPAVAEEGDADDGRRRGGDERDQEQR